MSVIDALSYNMHSKYGHKKTMKTEKIFVDLIDSSSQIQY